MASIELSCVLEAPPAQVLAELRKPRLLNHVARGRLRFAPVDPPELPEHWEVGEYLVALRGFGWLPLGHQTIAIETPPSMDRPLRDNGRSWIFRRWDHRISIEPHASGGTRYTDRVDFDAGWLTRWVAPIVRDFFRHRQRRLQALAAAGFDYSA